MTTLNPFCSSCGTKLAPGSLESVCSQCGVSSLSNPENYVNSTPNSLKITKHIGSGMLNLAVDAEAIRKAIKGAGTNNNKLREIVCNRTDHELGKIIEFYQMKYERDLIKDVHYDTLGDKDFRKILKYLLMPKHYLNAKMLRWAVKGLGTHEGTLNDILILSSNKDIILMKQTYDIIKAERLKKEKTKKVGKHKIKYNYIWEQDLMKKLFPEVFQSGKIDPNFDMNQKINNIKDQGNAERAIFGDTEGEYRKALLSLMEANRCENNSTNEEQQRQDAKDLYKKGEGRLGTNDAFFINLLTKRSPEQIQIINKEYLNLSKKEHTLRKAIMLETNGNYRDLLIGLTHTKIGYRVRKIYKCLNGLGTNDKRLMYLIVSCPYQERKQLVSAYKYAVDRDLVEDIKGDTSGDYMKTLLELIKP